MNHEMTSTYLQGFSFTSRNEIECLLDKWDFSIALIWAAQKTSSMPEAEKQDS